MSTRCRSLQVVVLAALLAGCGTVTSPAPASAPPASPAGGTPAATTPAPPATPAATSIPASAGPPASPVATPSPAPTPAASLPPPGPNGFVTPKPPKATAPWTGIRWQKVAASNPLAHVRSVTRWSRGFVATGDLVVAGGSARSKVWVSPDGARWYLLAAGVFGPASVVVGVAPTASGVVALTLQSSELDVNHEDDPTEPWSWGLTGPWQTWTSSDGWSWTAHPGPDFAVPTISNNDEDRLTLVAGVGNKLVALTLGGQPLAFSPDGFTWTIASLSDFPGGPAGWDATAVAGFRPGFVSVGTGPTALAITSPDGHAWTRSRLPGGCSPGALVVGRRGLIVVGSEGDPHSPVETWCSSLDGRSWRPLSRYQPLGVATASDDSCRGTCPNGILLGDSSRMVAYRGYPRQAGWTSFDGRTWKPLAFSGSRPTGWTDLYGYQYLELLTPIGLLFVNTNSGAAWLGIPRT
jgi:hypothetical protein